MPEIPLCAVSTRTSSYRFRSESGLLPFACALPRKGAAPAVLPCWMADCASLWETGGAGLIRLGGRVSVCALRAIHCRSAVAHGPIHGLNFSFQYISRPCGRSRERALRLAHTGSLRGRRLMRAATASAGRRRPSSRATTHSVMGMGTPSDWARCQTVRAL